MAKEHNGCEWKRDAAGGYYTTECNNRFEDDYGCTMEEYGYKFCPYCGKPIVSKPCSKKG